MILADGVSSFYFCPDLAGKGPRVALLVEEKWTAFLKARAGLPKTPFFSRQRRVSEPTAHANGQPWAWLYSPADVLKDEVRWLDGESFEELRLALEGAVHDALTVKSEQSRLTVPALEVA